jgi:thymidylate kinase
MGGARLDAIEAREAGYHERVRQVYESLWRAEPQRIRRIEAGQPREAVWAQIQAALEGLLPR